MPSTFANFLAVVEIRTKLVSVSTLLLATLYVSWRFRFPGTGLLLPMWAAALAVDMGTTAFNNYYDYWRGTDRHPDIREKDKVLVTSNVSPAFAFVTALCCFLLAAALGLVIAFTGNPWVIPVGAACMAVGFLYTGGPFPLSRTPFGELFAGGCLGFVLFSAACGVWSLPLDAGVAFAALPSTFWIASILTVNNTCDIKGDTEAGRKTLSILVGVKGGGIAFMLLGLLGQAASVLAALSGFLPGAIAPSVMAGTVPIIAVWVSMHRLSYSHATKGRNMGKILLCFIFYTVSVAAGFLFNPI